MFFCKVPNGKWQEVDTIGARTEISREFITVRNCPKVEGADFIDDLDFPTEMTEMMRTNTRLREFIAQLTSLSLCWLAASMMTVAVVAIPRK